MSQIQISESPRETLQQSTKILIVIVIAYSFVRMIVSHLELVNVDSLTTYSDIEFVIVASISTVGLIYAAKQFEKGTVNRQTLTWLSVGFLLWTIGEATWAYYEVILEEENPFPSIADVFYLVAYVPVVYALIKRARASLIPPERKRLILLDVLIVTFVIVSAKTLILPILDSEESTLDILVSIAYPIFDIALVMSALYLFSKYAGGKLENAWLLFSISMVLDSIADTLFSYEEWNETYNAYSWADDLFIWSYLITIVFSMYLRDIYGTLK